MTRVLSHKADKAGTAGMLQAASTHALNASLRGSIFKTAATARCTVEVGTVKGAFKLHSSVPAAERERA